MSDVIDDDIKLEAAGSSKAQGNLQFAPLSNGFQHNIEFHLLNVSIGLQYNVVLVVASFNVQQSSAFYIRFEPVVDVKDKVLSFCSQSQTVQIFLEGVAQFDFGQFQFRNGKVNFNEEKEVFKSIDIEIHKESQLSSRSGQVSFGLLLLSRILISKLQFIGFMVVEGGVE